MQEQGEEVGAIKRGICSPNTFEYEFGVINEIKRGTWMRLGRLCEHCSVPGATPSLQVDVSAFHWCDLALCSVNSEHVSSCR